MLIAFMLVASHVIFLEIFQNTHQLECFGNLLGFPVYFPILNRAKSGISLKASRDNCMASKYCFGLLCPNLSLGLFM